MKMKWIGAHVSAAGGVFNAPLNAQKIGATAYALFTKSQRQWVAPPLKRTDIDLFNANHAFTHLDKSKVVVHASYLINLASPDPGLRQKSLTAFTEEMRRCRKLGLPFLNFHPGAHLHAKSASDALRQEALLLTEALTRCKRVTLLVETTAGQGSHLGHTFDEIALLLSEIKPPERVKVCLDTCHSFNAGYDFRTEKSYCRTLNAFDSVIGLDRLAAVHLNDSKTPFGSRKDRHASIGMGEIGLPAFRFFMQDSRLERVPFILETPNSERWADEIALLHQLEND